MSPFSLREDNAEPRNTNTTDDDISARRGLTTGAVKIYA
jgi:hypothetical protein